MHALTSLRFFAAMYVVIHHTLWIFMPHVAREGLWRQAVALGYISVSFFFVLSGYILAMVYLHRAGQVAPRDFYGARFARVYPLYLLTLVIDAPDMLLKRQEAFGLSSAVLKTSAVFVGKLLMLQAWIPHLRGIDDPNWSLAVETLFYLCFPVLGIALWKLRGVRLWLVAAIVFLAGQAAVFLAVRAFAWTSAGHFPLLHLSTFVLGVLLARWHVLEEAKRNNQCGSRSYAASAAILVSLACLGAVVYWLPLLQMWNFDDGLLAPPFMGLIWGFSQPGTLPARILSAPWLVVLGEASFGLYLFHVPVCHLFQRLGWSSNPALFFAFLGLSIAVSLLSFYFFETPARLWVMKRVRAHPEESMEIASAAQ